LSKKICLADVNNPYLFLNDNLIVTVTLILQYMLYVRGQET